MINVRDVHTLKMKNLFKNLVPRKQQKDILMGRRRDRLDGRREKQKKTRAANAPRKKKERARKAAQAAAGAS